jgi:formylglycine-generating enzyme required for sulfatase activity
LITLSEYAIGRYPVTNSEYRFFIEGDGYKDDRWWSIEGLHWREGGPRAHESAINDWLEFRELISQIGVEKMASRLSWTSSNRRFWEDVIALSDEAARAQAESTFERPFDRPGQWDDPALSSPARPVVSVNWYEASAYCKWLSAVTGGNYRLPTEIEWEKAARGVNGRKYPWGDNFDFRKCNSVESQIFKTTPIGLYPKGVSPFGLWDVSGNVAEWTSSWYQAYPSNLFEQNEFGEKYRVVRGGSWNYNQNSVRCAYRSRNDPVDFSYRGFGFRLLSPKG